ncbi:mesoderm induction early response protein 2-like [Pelobates fuscus]|uniref:mesoderm induction early response protein 2-like n=1 Tax=Pelobates fuscus TaxID=191477 RepID=UPI002FE4EFD7
MREEEEADLSYEELLSFYGYQNSDPYSDYESEGKDSDTEQPSGSLDLEQQAEEASSQSDQMPPSLPSGGSSSLSPRSADYPEDWVSEPVLEEEEILGSQAELPFLLYTPAEERDFDEKDQLLWDPNVLPETEVESFLNRAAECQQRNARGLHRERGIIRDSEQALYELVKCSFNVEEALRRLYFNVKVIKSGLFAWSEDERRNFEQGFRVYGKNFHLIQANKVRTRSVGECVQYYYSWKKSKRFELFEKSRQGRRKHWIPPAFEYECDMPVSERPFGMQESLHSSRESFGNSDTPDTQNCSLCVNGSSNEDQYSSRHHHLSGPSCEHHQEASVLPNDLNRLEYPTQELPVVSDLVGLDLPLSTFSMTNMALPDILISPSRLCAATLAP